MRLLTPGQVAVLARRAGWTGPDVATAIAIAMAESSLNAEAIGGPNHNGSRDYGLWQINDVHHPTSQDWRNPAVNAAMAYKVWSDAGRSWRPWSTYNGPKYLASLPVAAAAAAAAAGVNTGEDLLSAPVDAAQATASALSDVGGTLRALTDQRTWVRVAKVLGGMVIIGAGVWSLTRGTVVAEAAQVARKAVPV